MFESGNYNDFERDAMEDILEEIDPTFKELREDKKAREKAREEQVQKQKEEILKKKKAGEKVRS